MAKMGGGSLDVPCISPKRSWKSHICIHHHKQAPHIGTSRWPTLSVHRVFILGVD